ncbi:MAG: glycine zipper 2TM domain-containing protein [Proteobacteria bacterium]|nr:glycine zipper 2TM domain-containing protein [Pseudomonadota bacterium]MBS0495020.1 glycine zipper 2TM domain-containing protein [Pseudomonadota bacterium]
MNKILILTALATAAMASQAQDLGRVLSATPITQQVAVPQQVCGNETIYGGPRPTTGGGAVLGAIAGGATGNAIGGGSGRAAATALGVIGGALLGNQVEAGRPGYQNVQRCRTETYYDNRVVGYDVAYEYAGRSYTTRTQTDPGQWIPITVQPAVPGVSGYQQPGYPPGYASGIASDDGYVRPGVVVGTQPGPPAYVVQPPAAYPYPYPAPYGYPQHPPRYNY